MGSLHEGWLDQIASVLETRNQGVILNDSSKRVVYANSMFLEMIRMDAGQLLGRSVKIGHNSEAERRESLAGVTLPDGYRPTRHAALWYGLCQSRSSVLFSTPKRLTAKRSR